MPTFLEDLKWVKVKKIIFKRRVSIAHLSKIQSKQIRIMSNYRRIYIPGGTFFLL